MGRIRSIKPEFPQSESIGRLSREARLLFVQLWTIADDEGRMRGNNRLIASQLYPYDGDILTITESSTNTRRLLHEDSTNGRRTVDDGSEDTRSVPITHIEKWMLELERERLIERYQVDGSHYLQVSNWVKHQKIDKAGKSRFPQNPHELVNSASIRRTVAEESANVRGVVAEESTTDLGSRILDLGSRKEDLGEEKKPPIPPLPQGDHQTANPGPPRGGPPNGGTDTCKENSSRNGRPRPGSFQPPSRGEVEEFVKAEKVRLDVERWWNHYEANGWRKGSHKMVDWRAAAREAACKGSWAHKPHPDDRVDDSDGSDYDPYAED